MNKSHDFIDRAPAPAAKASGWLAKWNALPVERRRFLAQVLGGACALGGAAALGGWALKRGLAPLSTATTAAAAPGPADSGKYDERCVADARYWQAEGEIIRCKLCPRECTVPRDERGYCGARENRGGQYKTLVYSRPCTLAIDPIEKKPLFHFHPASQAFSLATAGCNVECKFCQNWQTSQMRPEQIEYIYATPQDIVRLAKEKGCASIAYTYTEPVIFFEYAFDTTVEARKQGVDAVMISNGYIQKEPMTEMCKHISAVKIDLKAFTEQFYKDVCHGELKPVLATLELLKASGVWFEIVVLIIPTLNDGEAECRDMCRWVKATLGPDVPIHFTRFHPLYKLENLPMTPVETLERNYNMAKAEGLRFPYVGNVPGHKGESTYCPSCGKPVIERYGYVTRSNLKPGGACPNCDAKIPGVFA
ncbi:MAG: AmmeMemoRadiSam system radical SAM enzyme [Candidatus Sumerlaeota bacterium]|nr:AmmeMemoRadiSam system radical SAM enzyme [Candidatus Sumerlaeota bacterium]